MTERYCIDSECKMHWNSFVEVSRSGSHSLFVTLHQLIHCAARLLRISCPHVEVATHDDLPNRSHRVDRDLTNPERASLTRF